MLGVNKVILVGNLGAAPKMRYMEDGKAIAHFSVATHRQKRSSDGAKEEITEWHRVSAFGRVGEIAGQILDKGSAIYIEGRVVPKQWTSASGELRTGTEIWANTLQLLSPRRRVEATVPLPEAKEQQEADIPF